MFPYQASADTRLKAAHKAALAAEAALTQEKVTIKLEKAKINGMPDGPEKNLGEAVLDHHLKVMKSRVAYSRAMWNVYKAVVLEALPSTSANWNKAPSGGYARSTIILSSGRDDMVDEDSAKLTGILGTLSNQPSRPVPSNDAPAARGGNDWNGFTKEAGMVGKGSSARSTPRSRTSGLSLLERPKAQSFLR